MGPNRLERPTLWFVVLLSALLVSCDGKGGDGGASSQTFQGGFIASEKDRVMAPAAGASDLELPPVLGM
ncbi:MAG: hypothetical protein SWE60_20130 [Thermodesulfobacteriota bacterium]|nr:hypothetical protein [Thermodesulfobacteriota bacterium]